MSTTAESPAPARVAAPPANRVKRAYLHQVDLIRATTFALVIFVHCLTYTTDEFGSMGVNGTAVLFHATRNIFFALTGFVLMYQNLDRDDFGAVSFWRRRIKLVIIPYIVWSAIYWVVIGMWSWGRIGEIPSSLNEFVEQLGWGTAAFHLYFLFVMLQVYLLFPLIRLLVARTRGHHLAVLAVSLVAQVGIIAAISYWRPPTELEQLWSHAYATFLPYQFFIVLGAVAAAHRQEIADAIRGRGMVIVGALGVTGAFAVGAYVHRVVYNGAPINDQNSAFELTTLPFLIVAVTAIYAMGLHWATYRRPTQPRFAKAVAYAANRSFPVFLVHVMVLFWITYPKDGDQHWVMAHVPQPFGTALVYVGTVAGSLAVVELLRRLPGSLYLTGRPRLPWRLTI